ncbi:MAG: hypothetical protein GWN62_16935 [Aliifodinibius sp.]|nr:hypothetical protein [Fodinibius sp.]
MNTERLIWMALVVAILLMMFFRTDPGQGELMPIEYTIEFPEMSHDIPVPEPSRVTIIERTMPAEQIPDSMIRKMYDELAARYDTLNQIREYEKEIEDTNATGNIQAKVRGELLSWSLDYQIKPVTIRDTIRFMENRLSLFGTGGINSEFQPSVGIMAERNKWLIGVDYQPINQVVGINVGYRLFKVKGK